MTIPPVAERYVDANGEHWAPADNTEFGEWWLRCEETNRGTRFLLSVEIEFGPLVPAPTVPDKNEGEAR